MAITTTPNAIQIAEIRSLIGLNLSTDDIGDATVAGEAYFGGAYNFVFEAVVEGLTSRPADATALSGLFDSTVRSTQEGQFNRAVMYRTAGLLVGPAQVIIAEGAGGISQRYEWQQKAERQTYLFDLADDEIRRLREALPTDLFKPAPSISGLLSATKFFDSADTPSGEGAGTPTPGTPTPGAGLPSGGTAGQYLRRTATGYEWASVLQVPSGGSLGQILTKTDTGYTWVAAPVSLPSGGSTGQLLRRTATGYEWATVSGQFNPSNTGTAGQFLAKTATGYQWVAAPSGAFTPAATGDSGQVLTKTSGGYTWSDVYPTGTAGQVLSLADGFAIAGTYTQILAPNATADGQFNIHTNGYLYVNPVATDVHFFTDYWSNGEKWKIGSWEFTLSNASTSSGVYLAQFTTTAGTALTNVANSNQVNLQVEIPIPSWTTAPVSLPSGGSSGQYLQRTATGYQWTTIPTYTSFAPVNAGTANQVLTKTAVGTYQWSTPATYTSFSPSNTGSTGQVLTRTASGYNWQNASGGGTGLPSGGNQGQILRQRVITNASAGDYSQVTWTESGYTAGTWRVHTSNRFIRLVRAIADNDSFLSASHGWQNGQQWQIGDWLFTLSNTSVTTDSQSGLDIYFANYTTNAGSVSDQAGSAQKIYKGAKPSTYEWFTPTLVPSSGATGQVLTKTATGYAWQTPASGGGGGGFDIGALTTGTPVNTDLFAFERPSSFAEVTANRVSLTSNDYNGIVVISNTDFWILNNTSDRIEHWVNGSEVTADRVTLTSNHYHGVAYVSNTDFWLNNLLSRRLEHWVNGSEVTADRVSLNSDKYYNGLVRVSNTDFWVLNTTDDRLEHWTSGSEVTADRVTLTSGKSYYGVARVSNTDLWTLNDTDNRIEHWVNGSEVTADRISLTSGKAYHAFSRVSDTDFWTFNDTDDRLEQWTAPKVIRKATLSTIKFNPSNTGTANQVLTKTSSGYHWQTPATYVSFAPSNSGSTGQYLTKTASGYQWAPLDIDLSGYATKAELAGHEQDRYASYNNAFVQNSYRRGNIVLTTDTSGTPTQANQIGQPDIATGTGMLVVSAFLRTDADPNELAWATESNASDYVTGDIFYLSLDRDKGSYLKIELTGDGVKTGSGDGAYIYALATFTETGNVANVATAGDYFKISEVIPSSLQIEIPYTDILGAPWLNVDGSNVTQQTKDAIQGDNESVTLTPDFRVNATNVDYYAAWTESNKTLQIRLPSSQANTAIDTDLKRLLHPSAWVKIGGWTGQITTNATRSVIGTSLTFTSNYNTLEGTIPTDGATYKVTVVGEDVHRGELGDWAFGVEVSNTPATGQVLTKTATGYAWQTPASGGGGAFSIHDLTTDTIVTTDFIPFSNENETGDPNNKATLANVLKAGLFTGLTGSTGQVLTRTASGYNWQTPAGVTHTVIASDLSRKSAQQNTFEIASSYQTAIRTAYNAGKGLLFVLRTTAKNTGGNREVIEIPNSNTIKETIGSTAHNFYKPFAPIGLINTLEAVYLGVFISTSSVTIAVYNSETAARNMNASTKLDVYSVE